MNMIQIIIVLQERRFVHESVKHYWKSFELIPEMFRCKGQNEMQFFSFLFFEVSQL